MTDEQRSQRGWIGAVDRSKSSGRGTSRLWKKAASGRGPSAGITHVDQRKSADLAALGSAAGSTDGPSRHESKRIRTHRHRRGLSEHGQVPRLERVPHDAVGDHATHVRGSATSGLASKLAVLAAVALAMLAGWPAGARAQGGADPAGPEAARPDADTADAGADADATRPDDPDTAPADAPPARPDGPGDDVIPAAETIDQTTDTHEVDTCRRSREATGAEARAYEHYERGRNLYEQGDYEAAIEEFVLAYCSKRSPTVLKDIAQSFERLVEYEKAVAYLERYILENPEDEREERRVQSARVQVLRNLPAKIRIATEPRGASLTLTSSNGVRRVGFSNDPEPIRVPKGTYTVVMEMPGHNTKEVTIEVQIGQPYTFYYELEPKKGALRVVAQPSTASIFVDEKRVAVGSYLAQLEPGRYTVSAEADDHITDTREVDVTAGGNKNVSIQLQKVPRSGRTELLIASAIGGAAWGGGTFATLFGDDTTLGTVGGALGLGLGLGSAYLGVPDDIPVGHSSYIIGSSVIGLAEGFLVSTYFSCDARRTVGGSYEREGCRQSIIVGTSLAAAAGGLVLSSVTASRLDIDDGDMAIVNSGAMWGTMSGALFWVVFGSDVRIGEPLAFGGLNLGLIAGGLLAKKYEVSRGHVALIDLSGLLGLVVGASFVDVADQDSGLSERVPHFALLGMTVGLLTGAYFTRNMDEPPSLDSVSPGIGAARDAEGRSTPTIGLNGRF